MRIGELAERADVNVQTVRYYERRGLLDDPRDRGRGYREYTDDDLCRLRLVVSLRNLAYVTRYDTEEE